MLWRIGTRGPCKPAGGACVRLPCGPASPLLLSEGERNSFDRGAAFSSKEKYRWRCGGAESRAESPGIVTTNAMRGRRSLRRRARPDGMFDVAAEAVAHRGQHLLR